MTICTRSNSRAAPLCPNLDGNPCPILTAHSESLPFSELAETGSRQVIHISIRVLGWNFFQYCRSFLVDVTVANRGHIGKGVGHICVRFLLISLPTSIPTSFFSFFPMLIVEENVQPSATTSSLFISRFDKENLEIKEKKLRISKKLCWRSALCNLYCSKKSTKNSIVNRSWDKQT